MTGEQGRWGCPRCGSSLDDSGQLCEHQRQMLNEGLPLLSAARGRVTGEQGISEPKPRVRVASYLSPPDFHRLNWACIPIRAAFKPFGVFLVGSVTERPDFRDIDLRIIVPDEQYAVLCPSKATKLVLDIALSDMVAKAASLSWPIDLQFQSLTESQEYGDKFRNSMGLPR